MIIGANAGITDSYNRKFLTRRSYTSSLYGWKTNVGLGYTQSDPAYCYLYSDIYINHLRIDGQVLINSLTNIGTFDDTLDNMSYRDDGYGLGSVFIVDALNDISHFDDKGITFYTANYDNAGAGMVIKMREKTRMLLVFSDYWGQSDSSITWSLLAGYPAIGHSAENNDYHVINEALGVDFSSYTESQLSNEVNAFIIWSLT